MIVFVDTSVVLRHLFGQRNSLDWRGWEPVYASEILSLEARRAIDRLRLEAALDDAGVSHAHEELARLERHIGHVSLTGPVLQRAALPMPTVVKTLDAIHLTSALMLRERKRAPVNFATHDAKQATAARALGFTVLGA